jgi:hypothetical protein
MPIAKVLNGVIAKYPYTREDLQADHPNTCFMSPLVPAALDEFGVAEVALVNKPAADSGYKVVEGTPALVNGAWTQTWEQVELTPEEIAARIPRVVTMRQARLALLGAGLLLDVDAAIDNLSEPAKSAARIEWEYSGEVHRDKALVQALAPALGLTDAQLDQLFTTAGAL